MIEGFKIDIPAAELQTMLQAKADMHSKKAEKYERSVTATQEALDVGDDDEDATSSYTSNNIMPSVKGKVHEHRSKQAYFTFLADHLVATETYRLGYSDLGNLELTAGRY